MSKKLTYEFVKNKFEERGYTLLSKEYIGSNQRLDFICNKNHKNFIVWAQFNRGVNCSICTQNKKNTFEEVLNYGMINI